ncbi:MAG: hypothetical protein ABFR89_04550 [Actinomycetota bacterium]
MFTRLKWFALGSAATVGAGVYLGGKVKLARERITPETMARAGAVTVAGLMNATGRRMQRTDLEEEPEGADTGQG